MTGARAAFWGRTGEQYAVRRYFLDVQGRAGCSATVTAGCISDVGPFPGSSVQSLGAQPDHTSFYQDTLRQTKQLAFFASADYDIIPKVLTFTAGTRHFLFENLYAGSVISSFGCFEAGTPPGGCHNPAYSFNLNAQDLSDTETGWKSRANLTWHVMPDVMVYYTFSQGFRPGGFNQNSAVPHALDANGVAQYYVPRSYSSDKLNNNELGWKTEFFDHRLQWNGAFYQENWTTFRSRSSIPAWSAICSTTPTDRTSAFAASRPR